MNYFVTGATGFIGRHLIGNLLKRKGTIHVLIRKGSEKKFERIAEKMGWDRTRILPVSGDLSLPRLGVSAAKIRALSGKITHFLHLAAIYDISASAESQRVANIDGTRHAIALATALKAGCFHHTSSIAAAGLYSGVFREDMFEEAEGLDDPYLRTKHDAEGLVRNDSKIPWRIYRPGMVVGDSKTGEIDKIDGPYYMFGLIKKMRELLPQWMPKAAASTSYRWISSPPRWITSRTRRASMGIASTWSIPSRNASARSSISSAAPGMRRK